MAPAATHTGDRAKGFDRGAAVTRSLLGYGVIVGPFYLLVGIVQGLMRDGFDFNRHALSHLANGAGGWVQTINFVLSGGMVIAAAVGIARVLREDSRATSWFLGAFGVSMLAASIFRADPVDGFPPGTPAGMPSSMSLSGMLHFASGGLGFLCLATSGILAGFAMRRRGVPALAALSYVAGISVILGFVAPMVLPMLGPTVGIWYAVVAGWTWLAILSLHLYRVAPDPNCR